MGNAVTKPTREQRLQGSKIDTVTLAKQEREKQGPWEVEVSYGGEADLHKHLNGCVKNPGHHKFVPADQFNVDDLPPGCRDNDLVDYARALSDVTVRLSVKYVSKRRPKTVPGSNKPYPSYKDRGRNMMRTGTGWVWRVNKYPNKRGSPGTCECQECLVSPTPKTQFAWICMQTAAHVVYDELEAAHTTCHLFFDKGGSPKPRDCSGVLELSGWDFVGRGKEADWCNMLHVTHDLDLADLMDTMVTRRDNLREKVNNKYQGLKSAEPESSSSSEYLPEVWEKVNKYWGLKSGGQESSSPSEYQHEGWDKLTIIVSHPHGCSKQISVGYCTGRLKIDGWPTSSRYTTPTCPGSSGAPVFVMGDNELGVWVTIHVHCGNCEDDRNLNFSNYSWS